MLESAKLKRWKELFEDDKKQSQRAGRNLTTWKEKSEAAGQAVPGARPFKLSPKNSLFLRRTQVFLGSESNSQPGL